jgi:hypothetical protein
MQSSPEIRNKLVLVIGDLICRCIEEARKVPFILEQDQVVDILVANPDYFAKLVGEEQRDRTEYARDRLTAKLDAVIELGQFDVLDAFDVSLAGNPGARVDLEEVLKQVNQLTRTFAVYFGNIVTIFEKEFQLFAERFRQHLQQSGMALRPTEFTLRDMTALSERAESYLIAGHFLQAFSFDRVLSSQVISREVAILPSPDYSLSRNLIRNALQDANLCASFVKFLLRTCYISQGSWQDLFGTLVDLVHEEPALLSKSSLIDRIEQDGIFCCNLLCDSFVSVRALPADERRDAIDKRLNRWRSTLGGPSWVLPDLPD